MLGSPVVAHNWFYRDEDNRTRFFVPSRGIHDFTGGTVSLGDTIDSTALIMGQVPTTPPIKVGHCPALQSDI